jgi:hypothetical protein
MYRIVLIGLVLLLVALMVLAALVVQEYGWRAFLILVAVLGLMAYIAKKLLPRFFGYMLTRPLRQMGAALRGASIVVHSVVPCEPPAPSEDYSDDGDEAIEDEEEDPDDRDDEDEDDSDNPELAWYEVEFTVTPPDSGSSEGRIVHREAWMPGLIGAIGPRPNSQRAQPFREWASDEEWDETVVQNTPAELIGEEEGTAPDQVHGEHRVRMRLGVARHITAVTITYAEFTDIGTVAIPRIDIAPDLRS